MAEFIASYGYQLDTVQSSNMEESGLELVFEKCRNAGFHVDANTHQLLLPTLGILSPRLEKIQEICGAYNIDWEELTATWNLCSNLSTLIVSNVHVEDMRYGHCDG